MMLSLLDPLQENRQKCQGPTVCKDLTNRPEVGGEDGWDIVVAGGLVLAEEHLRLPVHEVRRDKLSAAEEHGDPEE